MKNFTEFFIKRPAFTIVISLVITIIGLLAFKQLPLRWIPNIVPPVVSIGAIYPGANSSLIENQITIPIENALAGVNGVESVYSSSKQGGSQITVNFGFGRDMNVAVEDVRSALQPVLASLPKGAEPPVIYKMDLDAEPIMYIAFSDRERSDLQLTDYIKQFIIPQLQNINGVAMIDTYGEREYAMHIWLDPMKMAAANITVDDVDSVLNQQNIQLPTGQIRGQSRYFSIVTNELLHSAEDFNQLIIHQNNNQVVRLKDIGQAVVDARSSDMIFRSNGKPALALAIIPQSSANPLSVADAVQKELKKISSSLPHGMSSAIVYNQATFIHASIDKVYHAIFEAIICVLVVIFLFLGHWRAALIPIITVPICLIGTFAILQWFNMSINTITLMALVLSIGLVVDDAIVMLENISRHVDNGLSPFKAAIIGSREMIFPIIAMTLTLVAVYAPIALTSGTLGVVFREFALTLAGAVLISGVIALTLSPMMCSRFLIKDKVEYQFSSSVKKTFFQLQEKYAALLLFLFSKKKQVTLSLIFVIFLGVLTYYFLPKELAPAEDTGNLEAMVTAPHNASFQYTDQNVKKIEGIIKNIPDITDYGASIGFGSVYKANLFFSLKDRNERKKTADEIAADIDNQTQSIPGVVTHVFSPGSPLTWYSSGNGSNIVMVVMSPMDFKQIHLTTQHLKEILEKRPEFKRIDTKLKWDSTQFELNINREKISDLKIPMQTMLTTLSTLLAGKSNGYFHYNGNQYSVIMQMNQSALANPNIISQLYVRNDANKMVPISDLITLNEVSAPEILPHFNRFRDDVLYASVAPGYTMGDAVSVLQKIASENLPENFTYAFQGEAKDYLDSSGEAIFTFLLAILFIYLILVAQFESFVDPFIILLTVPFAVIGALITLKLSGCSLNIYSEIGLVTLIGLIAKHGILITEFANQRRAAGLSIQEAVIEAALLRLRPIIMTTLAMILGAIPLALASGSGAESRQPIGWVIVGGLLLGTFFSLVVIPMAYTFFARWKEVYFQDETVRESEC